MQAAREFPPNPHALVIHTETRLTDEIVETYASPTPRAPEWVRDVLAVPGVRVLSLNSYKVRVQKHKDAGWAEVLDPVENAVVAGLGVGEINDLVDETSRTRTFCWHHGPFTRRVFEGRQQAQQHPVAARLFELPGVAEVILEANRVEVRICPLFSWDQLTGQVERVLEGLPPVPE